MLPVSLPESTLWLDHLTKQEKRKNKRSWEKDENYQISLKDKVWQVNYEVEITYMSTNHIWRSTSAHTDL